jgi:hypothetical protein
MVRTHQPGEADFRSILPEEIEWKPFAAFPPSVRLAVLVGEPSKPGPYVIRVKAPSVLPGDTFHFHWAKSGEYVTQVTAIGPLGLEYLDPGDDPRMPGHHQDPAPGTIPGADHRGVS